MDFDTDSVRRDLEKLSPEVAWAFYRLIVSSLRPSSLEQEVRLLVSDRPSGSEPR